MDRAVATPLLSVVVPTCRRPLLLRRGLDALIAQRLPDATPFEIVVVDDGRCDRTRRLVEALAARCRAAAATPVGADADVGWIDRDSGEPGPGHGRGEASPITLRYLRPRLGSQGPAAARNAGWHAARGAVIAFTDDDTIPQEGWLAFGLAALLGSGAAAVAGRVVVPPLHGPGDAPTDHEAMTRGLERAEFVTANAFVRRDALEAVGGFDERFTRAWREDSDLQFRLLDTFGRGAIVRSTRAVVLHPVRPERWGVSLRQQKNAFFEALLAAKHPARYRRQPYTRPPWHYYAIVVSSVAALLLALARAWPAALLAGAIALALVLRFAARRLAGTSHRASHVIEMLVTSALIPFLSVGWRLRGAWHFRTWFW